MDDKIKTAFEFAADATKQLITLATGVIALTITFSKDFIQNCPASTKCVAAWAWGFFLLSVIFGIWTLLGLTGTLEPKEGTTVPTSIRGRNVVLPSALQILSFIAGLVLTVIFGIRALG